MWPLTKNTKRSVHLFQRSLCLNDIISQRSKTRDWYKSGKPIRNKAARFVNDVEILYLMLNAKRNPFKNQSYEYRRKCLSMCDFFFRIISFSSVKEENTLYCLRADVFLGLKELFYSLFEDLREKLVYGKIDQLRTRSSITQTFCVSSSFHIIILVLALLFPCASWECP